ncbi:unnamed protein product [Fraxinus pennsylvanica]|uniref:Protein kinase domain-containing protein n=1 Tax=Fraxinus pennsylvanica TaxID=56036 RepID=A0AAD1YVT3_9LAMI|nr:unnamed protein product [Fraxinus pennsylvanica]
MPSIFIYIHHLLNLEEHTKSSIDSISRNALKGLHLHDSSINELLKGKGRLQKFQPNFRGNLYSLKIKISYYAGKSLNSVVLDWPSRFKIAVGAARGISYLHHDCIPHIIHRDIKSSNKLLDQNLEARVSDFGLATLMQPDKTHVSTLIAGTFGYLAPEYFDTGKATAKGDVYSFGVVLLELLKGKPAGEVFIEEGTKLVTWAKTVVQEKQEEPVLDSSLEDFPVDEVNGVFNIALMCLEPEPYKRPTMEEVLNILEAIKTDESVSEM